MTKTSNKKLILDALKEDIGPTGDITSECFLKKNNKSRFDLISNENGVLSGEEVFKTVFKTIDKNIKLKFFFHDGDKIKKKSVICSLYGNSINILKGERVGLNFISHLSGLATETAKLVFLIKDTKAVLRDTRKTTPLLRKLEKESIRHGGGKNHRMTLSDMILIKDNHIACAKNIKTAIYKAKKKYKKTKIEVEVENLYQLKKAIEANPDIIMFDNWNPKEIKEVIHLIPRHIETEASGQINPKNIKSYANTGVNYISTSYMVKNSKWLDFSLEAITQAMYPKLQ